MHLNNEFYYISEKLNISIIIMTYQFKTKFEITTAMLPKSRTCYIHVTYNALT